MSHAHHAFVQAASALPCWLAPTRFANSQFRPVDLPIFRPHQLTIEDAVGSGLDSGAALSGKSPLEPAVDNGAGNAKQPGKGALSAQGENCVVEVGFGLHDDIVRCMSSECQQEVAPTVQKLGMDVWRHIEEELHRRRLNAAWLGRKLPASRQVVSGWKKRGVPTARYEQIAALLGWTVDRLITGVADTEPQEAPAAPVAPAVLPVAQPAVRVYSPMALDLARMLDDIADDQQKRRAYALILQLLAMNSAPAPTAPAPQPVAPAAQPTQEPSRGR